MISSKNAKIEGAGTVSGPSEPISTIQPASFADANDEFESAETAIRIPGSPDETETSDGFGSTAPSRPKPAKSASRLVDHTSEIGGIALSFVS
ncbi:MAG: hypothetical protein ABSC92_12125, partial [Rhizomicrobium sp.]